MVAGQRPRRQTLLLLLLRVVVAEKDLSLFMLSLDLRVEEDQVEERLE